MIEVHQDVMWRINVILQISISIPLSWTMWL